MSSPGSSKQHHISLFKGQPEKVSVATLSPKKSGQLCHWGAPRGAMLAV